MKIDDTPEIFWKAFLSSNQKDLPPLDTQYQAWAFGDSPRMADNLAALVLSSQKTATASLHWVYQIENETLPQVGEYNIILSGSEVPLCIIRTIKVEIKPFDQVDAKFANDEGEGERTLAYWRKVHWEFFARECVAINRQPRLDMPVVCERFRLVYPEIPLA